MAEVEAGPQRRKYLNCYCVAVVLALWLALTLLSLSSVMLTAFSSQHLPDFSDPHKGFETRGTRLSARAAALDNLVQATRSSSFLTSNPEGRRLLLGRLNHDRLSAWLKVPLHTLGITDDDQDELPRVHTHTVTLNPNMTKNFGNAAVHPVAVPDLRAVAEDDISPLSAGNVALGEVKTSSDARSPNKPDNAKSTEAFGNMATIQSAIAKSNKEMGSISKSTSEVKSDSEVGRVTSDEYEDEHNHSTHNHVCSQPSWGHARLVISHSVEGHDMWSMDVVSDLCQLGKQLEPLYHEVCETTSHDLCCPASSLPNYLSTAANHSDCSNITQGDVDAMRHLLEGCARYFHNLELECMPGEGPCQFAPDRCARGDLVRSIMNYVLDVDFLPPNAHKAGVLRHVLIILPIARSSRTLLFYERLQRFQRSWSLKHIKIVAMDLGLKNLVFDSLLLRDSVRVGVASVLVVSLLLLATVRCTALVLLGLFNLILSLSLSYWLYCSILGAQRFPFLNLVAVLLLLAVGTDDVLFIAQGWGERCDKRLRDKLSGLSSLWLSVSATSVTTAAAMLVSTLSSVSSIALFGLFAGCTMLVHLAMTLFWMMPSVVLSEKLASYCQWRLPLGMVVRMPAVVANTINKADAFLKTWFLWLVSRLSLVCLAIMLVVSVLSSYALLKSPRLLAPDSNNFALFSSDHPFERYEVDFTHSFWFERHQRSSRDVLPLTWVWGVKPKDARDLLDPRAGANASQLVFDHTFDISKPKAQVFLLRFCKQLKRQAFYKSTPGPLLPNCFLESLNNYMSRRCFDSIDNIDRKPCCESSKFPYGPRTFTKCLQHAMRDFHNSPSELYSPGVAGPWFDTRTNLSSLSTPSAIVVQFDSDHRFSASHQAMETFYHEVEQWTNKMLGSAPRSMRHGFFTSDLGFFDLQDRLMTESVLGVLLAAGIASVVLYMVTMNAVVTMLASVSVYCSVTSSLALLALLGWRLNVLESLIVTMASGLSVDFTLHYAIKYNAHLERKLRIKYLLCKNLGPIVIATLTTASTGLILLSSQLLAFKQMGTFLLVLIANSFLFSNLGFLSLLYQLGPSHKTDLEFCRMILAIAEMTDENNVTSQAPMSESLSLVPPLSPELHEMENMSPTFLEDQSKPAMFSSDSTQVTGPAAAASSSSVVQSNVGVLDLATLPVNEAKVQELAILQPLLRQQGGITSS